MRIRLHRSLACIALLACRQESQRSNAITSQKISSAPAPADPVQLVREYVNRDARGERLKSNPWFMNVVAWPEEPGYDTYTIITAFEVKPLHTDSSTARVEVTYRRAGFLETVGRSTAKFVRNAAAEERVFTVALTDNGWRITAPQMDQHVLASAVPDWTPLTESDRGTLKTLAAGERGAQ